MINYKRSAQFLVILVLFAIACLLAPPPAGAVDKAKLDSEEVSKLLSEAKTEALELKKDAQEMESFTRSKLSWESHAATVERIKEHVNAVGRLVTKLNDARAAASPWQEQAIEQITPLLREMAVNTEATIKLLNANKHRLHTPEYKEYLTTNYEVAMELAALVTDFVDYGKAKNKFEHLRDKLEIERR